MTIFWIDSLGDVVSAGSDDTPMPTGAVQGVYDGQDVPPLGTIAGLAPLSGRERWNGTAWFLPQAVIDDIARETDIQQLRGAGKDIALVLTELVDWQLANTVMQATDFTPQVKQAYLDLKVIADRVKT